MYLYPISETINAVLHPDQDQQDPMLQIEIPCLVGLGIPATILLLQQLTQYEHLS